MHLDDAVLALEGLANGEGIVAASLRSSVADQGQAAFSDALGGTSLSGAARYLLRQTLSDLFIDWVAADEEAQDVPEAERADPAGIRAALPWMRGSGKRTAIDAALGRVVEVDADSGEPRTPGRGACRSVPAATPARRAAAGRRRGCSRSSRRRSPSAAATTCTLHCEQQSSGTKAGDSSSVWVAV